ncbi:hypothetical protein GCM10022235_19270 [Kribbella ginsengisoli]|uniref:Uncharacterized protein n=1 Tax=Kribbella ginsengisoli TaxID=363865 RepID=A0ABP6WIH7_9ACTN
MENTEAAAGGSDGGAGWAGSWADHGADSGQGVHQTFLLEGSQGFGGCGHGDAVGAY